MIALTVLIIDSSRIADRDRLAASLSSSCQARLERIIAPERRRQFILGRWLMAQAAGLPLQVRALPAAELRAAREVFLSSSAGGVLPVTRVDGQPVGDGAVGPVTRRMVQTYWDWHQDPRHRLALEDVAPPAG